MASSGWPAWLAAWLATAAAGLVAATALALLSSGALATALDEALGSQLASEAGVIAVALKNVPVDAIAAVGGSRSTDQLRERLGDLTDAGKLHDAALINPSIGTIIVRDRDHTFIAALADADLILTAAGGTAVVGPLYRSEGAPYRAAYAPLPGHPGWVVGVEGSGATLGAVDRLRELQLVVGASSVAVALLFGALLARAVASPLARLDDELSGAAPGDSPDTIHVQGPREVRRVAEAARRLLGAITDRDQALIKAHTEQIRQIEAVSAAVAHEVRNPLHALGMTVERLGGPVDAERRAVLAQRAHQGIVEIDDIVKRFLDLSRPVQPQVKDFDVLELVRDVIAEHAALFDQLEPIGSPSTTRTDPDLLRQVVRNLLLNAHQAGARRVVIRSNGAQLEVEDDGPGVAEADRATIFEWFHTTRAAGVGLGLPQSRRICRALGGDLVLHQRQPAVFRATWEPR